MQCTLTSEGRLSRLPPPEQEASQGAACRRLSLGPQSSAQTAQTAQTAASGSTVRSKRPVAGSTAKKGGGEGSRSECLLLSGGGVAGGSVQVLPAWVLSSNAGGYLMMAAISQRQSTQ